ncbi:MAG: methionyl-tRNA formyltransferase [bacterium]|nr:methionyl-tRNA formyltransferase [bacterium]
MTNYPRFVFFGSPEFAEIILERLITAGFIPAVVVCSPDAPVGRKKIMTPPPAKVTAEKYNIEVLQPETLANHKLQITNYKPDFFIVAAYSKILKKDILDIPKLGTIGVHPSLLPKYRGASPIQSAILEDEPETGTSLYLMDEKVDNGPILKNQKSKIKNQSYEELMRELAESSGNLLVETLPKFLNGEIKARPQNDNEATFTKKFSLSDGLVDLKNDPPRQVWLKIRALNPEPGVFTILKLKNGKEIKLKLLEADFQNENLELKRVQPEGKSPMAWKDFLNGYQDKFLIPNS